MTPSEIICFQEHVFVKHVLPMAEGPRPGSGTLGPPSAWVHEAWLTEASLFGPGPLGQAPLGAASRKLAWQSCVDQSLLLLA